MVLAPTGVWSHVGTPLLLLIFPPTKLSGPGALCKLKWDGTRLSLAPLSRTNQILMVIKRKTLKELNRTGRTTHTHIHTHCVIWSRKSGIMEKPWGYEGIFFLATSLYCPLPYNPLQHSTKTRIRPQNCSLQLCVCKIKIHRSICFIWLLSEESPHNWALLRLGNVL